MDDLLVQPNEIGAVMKLLVPHRVEEELMMCLVRVLTMNVMEVTQVGIDYPVILIVATLHHIVKITGRDLLHPHLQKLDQYHLHIMDEE